MARLSMLGDQLLFVIERGSPWRRPHFNNRNGDFPDPSGEIRIPRQNNKNQIQADLPNASM